MKKIYSFIVLSLALMSCSVSTETKNNQLALTNEINTIYQQKKFNGFAVSIVKEGNKAFFGIWNSLEKHQHIK